MFENAFSDFLNAWNFHQSLRGQGATIEELSMSRAALDAKRLNMFQAR